MIFHATISILDAYNRLDLLSKFSHQETATSKKQVDSISPVFQPPTYEAGHHKICIQKN